MTTRATSKELASSTVTSGTATFHRMTTTANSATVCENGTAHLNCLPDQRIVLRSVYYGGKIGTDCPDPNFVKTNSDCNSTAAFDVVSSACNYRSSCNLLINDTLITDPCPTIYKYFMADYVCIQVTIVTECQGNSAKLECFGGEVIHVVDVFYGRRDTTTCPNSVDKTNRTCQSDNELKSVSDSCNGNVDCMVHVNTELSTNICRLGSNYLQIEYLCVA